MKKLIFICMMSVLSLGAFAQNEQGESSVGFNLGYGFDTENMTLGIDYRYNFTDGLRLAPSLTYYVKKDRLSAWAIDLNAHYLIMLSEMVGFYPLAGLDLSFWKHKLEHGGIGTDSSIDRTRFGVNLGLGAELYATKEFSLGLEAKYTIIKNYDQVWLGLRLGYNF